MQLVTYNRTYASVIDNYQKKLHYSKAMLA